METVQQEDVLKTNGEIRQHKQGPDESPETGKLPVLNLILHKEGILHLMIESKQEQGCKKLLPITQETKLSGTLKIPDKNYETVIVSKWQKT